MIFSKSVEMAGEEGRGVLEVQHLTVVFVRNLIVVGEILSEMVWAMAIPTLPAPTTEILLWSLVGEEGAAFMMDLNKA